MTWNGLEKPEASLGPPESRPVPSILFEPLPALLTAAKNGDQTAMGVAADRFQERDDPGNPDAEHPDDYVPPDKLLAAGFRVLATMCVVHSAQLRAINAALEGQPAPPPFQSDRRLNANATTRVRRIEAFLYRSNIPYLEMHPFFSAHSDKPGEERDPEACSLYIPHDGEDQTATAQRLLGFLSVAFPGDHVVVVSRFTDISGGVDEWAPWKHAAMLLGWDTERVWARSHQQR